MDIAGLAIVMSQTQLMQNVSMAVLKMVMDVPAQQVEELTAALSSMKRSVNPHVGSNIDVSG